MHHGSFRDRGPNPPPRSRCHRPSPAAAASPAPGPTVSSARADPPARLGARCAIGRESAQVAQIFDIHVDADRATDQIVGAGENRIRVPDTFILDVRPATLLSVPANGFREHGHAELWHPWRQRWQCARKPKPRCAQHRINEPLERGGVAKRFAPRTVVSAYDNVDEIKHFLEQHFVHHSLDRKSVV